MGPLRTENRTAATLKATLGPAHTGQGKTQQSREGKRGDRWTVLAIHDSAVAALDRVKLEEGDCKAGEADRVDEGDDMDGHGAAVEVGESRVIVQRINRCVRFSAKGTFELQLAMM